jgi:hypothetical protein
MDNPSKTCWGCGEESGKEYYCDTCTAENWPEPRPVYSYEKLGGFGAELTKDGKRTGIVLGGVPLTFPKAPEPTPKGFDITADDIWNGGGSK